MDVRRPARRSGTPAERKAVVDAAGVRHPREATTAAALREELHEFGAAKVERVVADAPIRPHVRREAHCEVRTLEELTHSQDVTGKEQVVVAQVADDRRRRVPQRLVSQSLAALLSFRAVVEPDPWIGDEWLEGAPRVVLDAVADDKQLDLGTLLRERTPHRERKQRSVSVCRDEDRGIRHGAMSVSATRLHDSGSFGDALGEPTNFRGITRRGYSWRRSDGRSAKHALPLREVTLRCGHCDYRRRLAVAVPTCGSAVDAM